ncbi:MAG TPA: Gfo/Idh/MocA family oxidoreductase [Coriobacteriia bacterium]|nr:Gfo/Idh/MocA family oxidoreductase [Coriobacteriia bacterium]
MHSPAPLRLALVGAGRVAMAHLAAADRHPELVEFVACADPSTAVRTSLAETHPGVAWYPDVESLLAGGERVELAVVATPHAAHLGQIVALARAGIAMLVEKPVVLTAAQAREALAAVEESGVTLVAGQTRRFARDVEQAAMDVAAGDLGPLNAFAGVSLQNLLAYTGGAASWFMDGAIAGGGSVISHGIHIIDVIRFVSGEDVVLADAQASTGPPMFNGADSDTAATLQLAGGAVGTLLTSYRTSPDAQRATIDLFFDDARLWSDSRLDDGRMHLDRGGASAAIVDGDLPDPFETQLIHTVDRIRGNAPERSSLRQNFNTLATIDAIARSAATGRRQPVEER